ncbi:MAG TPA: hypothetical protein VFR33_05625 [Candidatus Dormibacteraeota bacterium]|nr:hypothetical protein [Candidatus Dormibacteraeota bacterium]
MSDMEQRNNDRRVAQRGPIQGEERRRGPDALRSNPEVMERNDVAATRSNPEVMGRSEPQAVTAPRHREMSSEMSDIWMRFEKCQSEFIDDPKSAVKNAEKLIEDMFNKMRERVHNTHRDIEKNDDTEHLRLAMRSYREMLESFEGRRTVV